MKWFGPPLDEALSAAGIAFAWGPLDEDGITTTDVKRTLDVIIHVLLAGLAPPDTIISVRIDGPDVDDEVTNYRLGDLASRSHHGDG